MIATARDVSDLVDLAADGLETLPLDVRDPMSVDAALAAAGAVEIVVNNAGYGVEGAVEEVGDDDLREQFETNVFGVWRICRGVLPGMRERASGTIVNVSSFGGQAPFPGIGAYRSSKFALEGLTWTLRLEVAHFGIRVLSVQPGLTASQFGDSLKRAQYFDAGGAYAAMRERAAVAYARMSPGSESRDGRGGDRRRRSPPSTPVAHPRRQRRPPHDRLRRGERGCVRARARRGPRLRLAPVGLRVKVALVTGAASGIGRATARLFADAGYAVVGADRNADGLRATLSDMQHARCGRR